MDGNPVVIGVAGGSGSGKTTVVSRIVDSMGDDQVIVLEHDRYYHDHRTSGSRNGRRSTTTTRTRSKPT